MRLPGCWHFDKKTSQRGGMTTIVHTSDNVINTVQMDRLLPDKVQVQKHHELRNYRRSSVSSWEPRSLSEIQKALDCIPPRVPGSKNYHEHRNALWGLKHALEEIGRDPSEAASLYATHSPQWKDVAQVARYEDRDAWAGWFWRVASNHGYDLTRAKRQQQRMPSLPVGKDIRELTVDDILGPVEDDKLRNPRADRLRLLMEVAYQPKFNELTQAVEIDGKPVKSTEFKTLHLRMAEELMVNIQKDRAIDSLVYASRKNTYHPVRDYLNSLATRCEPLADDDWELIAHTIFGAEDPNANMFLQRQLIGFVARVLIPGCKFDTALVIHSDDQGIGKSEFWSVMGGPWFSDSLGSLKQVKDDLMILHRAWIHEWGEIDRVFGKTASENLKHFLTIKEDHFRPPYGGAVDGFPRQCGIVGTTNSNEFIKDPTGNRRYPCFTANKVDLEWVRQRRDAIWLRCLNEFHNGTRYWYEGEELQIINDTAQQFAEEDFVFECVRDYVNDADTTTFEAVIYGVEGWDRFTEDEAMRRRIKTAMKRLGYRQSRNKRCPTTCPTLSHVPLRDRKRRPRVWEKRS
jgi:predicted P-loop ATPase